VLALAAAASICLVVAVLRLLRHAQSQDAVRKEAQALLLRASARAWMPTRRTPTSRASWPSGP